ncbi:MAG: nitrate- and nitrite sensing domain-containing protein [Acidimicrobiales bacterium]
MKNLSFRAKLTLIVLPQLVVLLAFAGLVIKPRTDDASAAAHARLHAEVARETMNVIDALQEERGLSSWVMAGGGVDARELLRNARTATDGAVVELLERTDDDDDLGAIPAASNATTSLQTIAALRSEVDGGATAPDALFDRYTAVVDSLIAFNTVLVVDTEEQSLVGRGIAVSEFLAAKEQLGLLQGTVVRRLQASSLGVDDLAAIDSYLAAQRAHLQTFRSTTDPANVVRLEQIEASEIVRSAERVVATVRTAAREGTDAELTADEFWTNVKVQFDALDTLDDRNYDDYVAIAADIAASQRNEALLYTLVAATAVLGSIAGALLLGRSLNNRLASIAEQAHVISHERLPEVLEALRHPTAEALAEALPQVQADATDEIGTMADAFNVVLRTSVETSFNHAQERARTVTNMLLNLGRRNQSLIDRQLAIMDELESRHDDPDLLERLFRIDHLVTRMRRNAENLVVLAGEHQPRAWTEAVPMLDVLRAATGEVPDLDRIEINLAGGDDVEIAGPHAVTLSHLLAELVENAMAFSPPSTKVALSTDRVRGQLRVWVVDNGLGMEDEELAEANARLVAPPDIDVLTTDRIGFQVVGRLAQQLGVHVHLQANPEGGVAASVVLPAALFELPRREGPGMLVDERVLDLRDPAETESETEAETGTEAWTDTWTDDVAAEPLGATEAFAAGVGPANAEPDAIDESPPAPMPVAELEEASPFGSANGFERYDNADGTNGFRRVPMRRVPPPADVAARTPRVFQFEPDVPDGADELPVIDLRDGPAAPSVPFGVFRPDPAAPANRDHGQTPDGLPKRTPRALPTEADRSGNGHRDATGHHDDPVGMAADGGTPPPDTGGEQGAMWLTADGLVKRRPGGTMATNTRAAEADAGAFRRLPDAPRSNGEEEGRSRRRFADLSRLQSAVAAAREHETDTEGAP